jgi:hypothetical protein
MKQRILLFFVMTSLITALQAQKNSKTKAVTGYAITAADKGGRSWKEVRLVDINTGEVVKTIYDSKNETEALNARTGKPVVKKDGDNNKPVTTTITTTPSVQQRKVVNLDEVLDKNSNNIVRTYSRVVIIRQSPSVDKPFSTNSAAMAYDKKHERLYYTPMSINQLRYIDLKSGKIYYFEDEPFGTAGRGDVNSQITRMVIAADGNGYALTNDANHLIRFTTGKKPEITDLGAITDDGQNEMRNIHTQRAFGGDMIADGNNNLYLITAGRAVYKISIENRSSNFLGTIKGLPEGFSTNGAMVEEGSKVIIASSESVAGYYRFDLNTLLAEKVSTSSDVFNASDLANGMLAFEKKKKDKTEEPVAETKPVVADNATAKGQPQQDEGGVKSGIAVYPNPVTNGVVRLSFSEQPAGRYQVQLLDMSGRLINSKEININSESQIEEFRFPELSVKGNYLLKVSSEVNRVNVTNKVVVQ